MREPARLPGLLGATVPPEWPHEDLLEVLEGHAEALEENPALARWGLFLVLDRSGRHLIGDAGFKGPPDEEGAVEIGYGIAEPFRGRGCATEAVGALLDRARRDPQVRVVRASCLVGNAASRRVLEKSGFRLVAEEDPYLDYELVLR